MLTFLPRLLRPSREGTLCLHPLKRAPGALMSDASPVSRALLVLCINQGISASFSLLLSYCWLRTTRFWSIKGPQQLELIPFSKEDSSFSYPLSKIRLFSFSSQMSPSPESLPTQNTGVPPETSLAVLWLRHHASTAGVTNSMPGQGTRVLHAS